MPKKEYTNISYELMNVLGRIIRRMVKDAYSEEYMAQAILDIYNAMDTLKFTEKEINE